MYISEIMESLSYVLKNETDGFMATVMAPNESGLTAYVIFNCYGNKNRRFLIPQKHRRIIVEIAKDLGGHRHPKKFDWSKLIPVSVSEYPQILLRNRKLACIHSIINQREWEEVFGFVILNRRQAIERHWRGESSSLELFDEIIGAS